MRGRIFWLGILTTLLMPGFVLQGLVNSNEASQNFFCYGSWHSTLETVIAVLVPSFLHHMYWLGRKSLKEKGQALALTLLLHGILIVPGMVYFWATGHWAVYEKVVTQDHIQWMNGIGLLYWFVIAVVVARLKCLWGDPVSGHSISFARRIRLMVALPSVTFVVGFFLLALGGPCHILNWS